MTPNDRPKRRDLAGAALLCLALAAIPAVAGACDMKAVDDELAREAAAPPAPQLHAAAETSTAAAADPSPDNDEAGKPASAKTSSPPATGSGAASSATSQNAAKPGSPIGHTAGTEQKNNK